MEIVQVSFMKIGKLVDFAYFNSLRLGITFTPKLAMKIRGNINITTSRHNMMAILVEHYSALQMMALYFSSHSRGKKGIRSRVHF